MTAGHKQQAYNPKRKHEKNTVHPDNYTPWNENTSIDIDGGKELTAHGDRSGDDWVGD